MTAAIPPIKGWIELPDGSFTPPVKCEAPDCDEWMCWAVAVEHLGTIAVCDGHRASASAILRRREATNGTS